MSKLLEVFEPAMCCATGVCGVTVDPVLAQFAADVEWLREQGVRVERYNLSQQPEAFAANAGVVREMEAGIERLPIVLIDGKVAATHLYPSREQLARQLGLDTAVPDTAAGTCKPDSGCC